MPAVLSRDEDVDDFLASPATRRALKIATTAAAVSVEEKHLPARAVEPTEVETSEEALTAVGVAAADRSFIASATPLGWD
jgi:hypothetical protein